MHTKYQGFFEKQHIAPIARADERLFFVGPAGNIHVGTIPRAADAREVNLRLLEEFPPKITVIPSKSRIRNSPSYRKNTQPLWSHNSSKDFHLCRFLRVWNSPPHAKHLNLGGTSPLSATPPPTRVGYRSSVTSRIFIIWRAQGHTWTKVSV